jgi:hypothetical protein
LPKEQKTEAELLDLVRQHVERNHHGPLTGAQYIEIIQVLNDPAPNWRASHSGEAGGDRVPLEEADAELTSLYDLQGS